jgi:hypothetical protein
LPWRGSGLFSNPRRQRSVTHMLTTTTTTSTTAEVKTASMQVHRQKAKQSKASNKQTNKYMDHSPSLFNLPRFHGNGSGGTGIGAFNVKVGSVFGHDVVDAFVCLSKSAATLLQEIFIVRQGDGKANIPFQTCIRYNRERGGNKEDLNKVDLTQHSIFWEKVSLCFISQQ